MGKLPFVSVIIPVYNDLVRLKQCLTALQKQTYPKDRFEILVINNDSTDDLSEISSFKNVHLSVEKKPGSFAARNNGICLAKGEILTFTDSDCLPSSVWIENGVKALVSNAQCGIVGGAVHFCFKIHGEPNSIELYDSLFFLQQKRYVEEIKFSVTANLFTYMSIFNAVGLFDENLKSGGDGEWGKRVFEKGYGVVYSDDAVTHHPARNTLPDLFKKIRRVTGGKYLREKRVQETFVRFWQVNFYEFLYGMKRIFNLKEIEVNKKIELVVLELLVQFVRLHELVKLKYGKISER